MANGDLRMPVAIETPLHLQTRRPAHQRHAVDSPVATFAPDPLGDVNRVIEINKVGNVVDASPLQRLVRIQAGPHRCEQWTVVPDLRMAPHADFGCRHAGERALFHRRVTVAAVNPQSGDVMIVTKRDRLISDDIKFGDIRRAQEHARPPSQPTDDQHASEDRGFSNRVRAWVKQLRHGYLIAQMTMRTWHLVRQHKAVEEECQRCDNLTHIGPISLGKRYA